MLKLEIAVKHTRIASVHALMWVSSTSLPSPCCGGFWVRMRVGTADTPVAGVRRDAPRCNRYVTTYSAGKLGASRRLWHFRAVMIGPFTKAMKQHAGYQSIRGRRILSESKPHR